MIYLFGLILFVTVIAVLAVVVLDSRRKQKLQGNLSQWKGRGLHPLVWLLALLFGPALSIVLAFHFGVFTLWGFGRVYTWVFWTWLAVGTAELVWIILLNIASTKASITISENEVFGKSISKWFWLGSTSVFEFQLPYDKITSVDSSDGGRLTIYANMAQYRCYLSKNDAREVRRLIQEKMNESY